MAKKVKKIQKKDIKPKRDDITPAEGEKIREIPGIVRGYSSSKVGEAIQITDSKRPITYLY